MRILIAAGGSGGHLLPAQELGELLQLRGHEVVFAGYKLAETPYFHRDRFAFREIASSSLKKKGRFLFAFLKGFVQAVRFLRREHFDVVVGFGSYHTVPVLAAASVLRRNLVLYEANRVLGKVNRLFSRSAKKVALQFPLIGRGLPNSCLVPLFPWTERRRASFDKQKARESYGLDPERRTILVFGGSQGAAFLNEVMPQVAAKLPDTQFIHLAGNEPAANALRYPHAHVKAFETNMPLAYAAADLVVCRAGAGTIAELIRFGVPAVLIPYPYAADDHQRHNALYLVERGAAKLILQRDATAGVLAETIHTLPLAQMRLALSQLAEQNGHLTKMEELVCQ